MSHAGQRFDTLVVLIQRELRTRYKGSFFGLLWAVLSPLGTVVVFQFIFGKVLEIHVPHFGVFIYSGLLPWVWFSTAVQTSSNTLSDNRDLVRIPFFSMPLLPAIVTLANFLLYLFALPVLVLLSVADGVPLSMALLFLPVIWIVQAALTLAVCVFVAAIGILVRDVQHLMGVVLLLWFYLTPVFYDVSQVPARYSRWFELNPMTSLVTAHRAVTLESRAPDWSALAIVFVASCVFMALSVLLFRSLEGAFVERA